MKNKISTKYIISLLFITISITSARTIKQDIAHVPYTFTFDQDIGARQTSYHRQCILDGKTIGSIRYSTVSSAAYIQILHVKDEYLDSNIRPTLFSAMLTHLKIIGSSVVRWHASKEEVPFYEVFGSQIITENSVQTVPKNWLDFMEYSLSQDGNSEENLKQNDRI